jgi:hypothetical protein
VAIGDEVMPTVQTASQAAVTLSVADLETLIRRVVREEVAHAFEAWGFYEEPTVIESGSPVHENLVETLRIAEAGVLKILSREEALNADQ